MHLRELGPLTDEDTSENGQRLDWSAAADRVRRLTGPHFTLTVRADRMLEGNPYPRPQRMLMNLQALAGLARRYHDADGDLGRPLDEIALREFGIEIALTDKGLGAPVLSGYGGIRAEPHVKVDDHKKPHECGRIYFAIDRVRCRFVVDHIGLHDYP